MTEYQPPDAPVDVRRIMDFLPHRYPFLMIDKVVAYEPETFLRGYKNVTINEPCFQGHFPGLPVMPGVLILEALAQAGALLVSLTDNMGQERGGKIFLFTGMDKIRFRRSVRPGDKLEMEVFDIRRKLAMIKMKGVATVDGEMVTQGEMSAALVEKGGL